MPPPDARWRFGVGAPRAGEVICHNDVAPWNTVARGARPVALIDWDFAAPGPPVWDVAYACWRFSPLYAGDAHFSLAERARRMVAFCEAYGLHDRRDLTEVIDRRQTALFESLQAWAEAGIPAFVRLWQEGHGRAILADRSYLRHHRAELDRRLCTSPRRSSRAT